MILERQHGLQNWRVRLRSLGGKLVLVCVGACRLTEPCRTDGGGDLAGSGCRWSVVETQAWQNDSLSLVLQLQDHLDVLRVVRA